jgi:hypothetical protein
MLEHDFLCMVPIPKQIPVSTLVCPPATAFAKQYSLPVKSSMTENMSPSPMSSQKVRQQRLHHHMQTAPMEALQRAQTQKSLNIHGRPENMKGNIYSPLVANCQENSANDNGQIMGSEKTNGTTPLQPGALIRQISIGPAVVSEFNPCNEDFRE